MLVLAVASRTTGAVTVPPPIRSALPASLEKFGSLLGIAKGSTNIGVIRPTAFYAPTPIRVTAAGGNFTGGKIRLVLYAMSFAAPTG